MNRTERIIEYLKRYQYHCDVKSNTTANKHLAEALRKDFNEVDKLIKELKEHGCRRTVDET